MIAFIIDCTKQSDPTISITSGILRPGNVEDVIITIKGSEFTIGNEYRLVIKNPNDVNSTPFTINSTTCLSATTITFENTDLRNSDFYSYISSSTSKIVNVVVRDVTEERTIAVGRITAYANPNLPEDTAPVNGSQNTYTDAEVRDLIAGVSGSVQPDVSKDPLADTDRFTIWDSEDEWLRKYIDWLGLKTRLKEYFDNYYGDMQSSIYDTNDNDIVDKAESLSDGDDIQVTATQAKEAYDHSQLTGGNPHNVTANDIGAIPTTEKGAANGVAELDASGRVPTSQLPSYVDDVLEFATASDFPATGEAGKIYVALDTNLTYRWGGTSYVEISPSLALGETSDTAYRGDRGKIAYDHSQLTSGNPHNVTKDDIGLGDIQNIKHNFSAVVDPTATDDASAGYSVGSRWINTDTDTHWVCVDNTEGAAVWEQTNGGSNGGGTVQGTDGNALNIRAADEGTIAGNARGEYSVDFQTVRSSASQVASGEYAFLGPGYRCKVSGARGTCLGGYQCNVNEQGAASIGADNAGLNHRSSVALGSRYGSSQIEGHVIYGRSGTVATYYGGHGGMFTLGRQTTDATQTELISTTNQRFVLENNQTIGFRIVILARQVGGSSGTVGDSFRWVYEGLIKRGADASATTLVDATQQYANGDAGASGWSVSIEADTTNGALVVKVTGEADKTVNWMANVFIERLVGG